MALGNYIKDNLALVAGIALPLALVTSFVTIGAISKAVMSPPAHIAYFSHVAFDPMEESDQDMQLSVADDGKLVVAVTTHTGKDSDRARVNSHMRYILAYDATTNTLTKHPIEIPGDIKNGSFTPKNLNNLRLSPEYTSPDGYEIYNGERDHNSYFEYALSDFNNTKYRIRKAGAVYNLPEKYTDEKGKEQYISNWSFVFLGWDKDARK